MARVKGGLFTTLLDVNKRFPLDSRALVAKREDLINPTTWITNTLTTEATYNVMVVSVNSDGEHNGVYYLNDRKAITAENYTAYQTALETGEDVGAYFAMWTKLCTLDDLDAVIAELDDVKSKIGVVPEGKTIIGMISEAKPMFDLTPVDGTIVITDSENGGKAIGVAVSEKEGNSLVAVDGGLFVPTLSAGDGIEIIDNKVNVKLAENTHGLVAVGGALALNLATQDSDGAMSKEDKVVLDTMVDEVASLKSTVSNLESGFKWCQW